MRDVSGIKLCAACGVPRRLTRENVWLSNGKVVERKNPSHRMMFIENESITGVFSKIEEILGISIGHIIEESERRLARDYVDAFLPGAVKFFTRLLRVDVYSRRMVQQGRLMGFGDIEILEMRLRRGGETLCRLGVRNVWFPAAFSGVLVGSLEALLGLECVGSYEERSPGYHVFTTAISTKPRELEGRLAVPVYADKPGDVELPRCASCGAPRGLADFEWRLSEGTIISRVNGQRMIVGGPGEFEAIFEELERELGEDITRLAAEAQRRLVREKSLLLEAIRDFEDFRYQLALRGLGNLREMEWKDDGLRLRLENPCLKPVLIGLTQGLFEASTGKEGKAEWEEAPDGDLSIAVRAAS